MKCAKTVCICVVCGNGGKFTHVCRSCKRVKEERCCIVMQKGFAETFACNAEKGLICVCVCILYMQLNSSGQSMLAAGCFDALLQGLKKIKSSDKVITTTSYKHNKWSVFGPISCFVALLL